MSDSLPHFMHTINRLVITRHHQSLERDAKNLKDVTYARPFVRNGIHDSLANIFKLASLLC